MHDPRAADEMANSANPDQTAALFYRTAMICTLRNIINNAGKMEKFVNHD